MKIIERVDKELERISASSIICNKHFFGESQYQLLDEQWESDFMFSETILDFLCDIIDGTGRDAVWDYLRFKRIPIMPAPQTDDWRDSLRLSRLEKKGNNK